MPYIKRTYYAGDVIEIYKTYSARYGVKSARSANRNHTPEDVARYNERLAERRLRLLLNENFKEGDYYLTLTYRKSERPDAEGAKEQLAKFIRKVRTVYQKAGVAFRWVSVTEYRNKAIHHHMVINQHDIREVVKLWRYGRPQIKLLDDTGDYSQLAEYLIKETSKTFTEENSPIKKRWSCSRNLNKPRCEVEIIKAKTWRDEPQPLKGYFIVKDSVYQDVSPVTHHPYMMYRMVRIKSGKKGSG